MALTIGSQLGSLEITALLGKGGMGEVYRARDLKLKREVAVKILPEEFDRDADRLSRFQREAEILASLNHPNIAAIYDIQEVGSARFIVLELVEGETLAERIERGPIPEDEALRIAASICDALEAAHEKGIVHRDLKPANVKLAPNGKVKVLDFGLAKPAEVSSTNVTQSQSPTLMSLAATNAGVILGTAPYMSPEQARGNPLDKRTDIWAFGVVVYEMLTGKSPFVGPTLSDTLAFVLTKDPDLSVIPDRVRPLLRRCFERDVRKRLRDIGDAAILLEPTVSTTAAGAAVQSGRLLIVLAVIAILTTITAAVFAYLHFDKHHEVARRVEFQIPVEGAIRANSLTVSPDGSYIAFQQPPPSSAMKIRALDTLQPKTILQTVASRLGWSPDSRSAIFQSEGKLKRVDIEGGLVQSILDVGTTGSPIWMRDKWLYRVRAGEFMQLPTSGGPPARFLSGIPGLLYLQFLPDEHHFLFSAGDASVAGTTLGIFLGSIDTAESLGSQWKTTQPIVTTDVSLFSIVPSSDERRVYIVFAHDGAVIAQAFDTDKLQVSGPPVTVVGDASDFAVSRDVLVYRPGRAGIAESQLRWYNRKGSQVGTLGEPVAVGSTFLSRDGKIAMMDRVDSGINRVWLGDIARGVFTRLTSGNTNETAGALTPDGSVVYTSSGGGSAGDLYLMRANSATPELLTKSAYLKHPNDISPDGKHLIYDVHGNQAQDLWILPLNAGNDAKPIPFLTTAADETFGQFSPDGKWVAYKSNESGRSEVYVRAFLPDQSPAAGGRKWIVSTTGGDKPRWSRDGKELFYIAPEGTMMATPVKIGTTFEPGIPVALFDMQAIGFFPYDVSTDGRFLINTPLANLQSTSSSINVILNWSSILMK